MRKPTLYSLVLILSLLFVLPTTLAQRPGERTNAKTTATARATRGLDTISAALFKDYLSFIASDEMEGRDTPSRGLDTVAKFIAMNLGRWGFKPAGDDGTFFQHIALRRNLDDNDGTGATINGEKFSAGTDFIAFQNPGTVSGSVVYAGQGWFIKSKNIDAYRGLDVKDKIVVVNTTGGFPKGTTQADLTGKQGVDWADQLTYAQMRGAKAMVGIASPQYIQRWEYIRQRISESAPTKVERFEQNAAPAIPRLVISTKMATALMSGEKETLADINAGMAANEPTASFDLNPAKQVSITVAVKTEHPRTQNIVAVWEGADPILKNEYVALGAHYDHIGICAPGTADPICNGADDDGSGTTALLGMAEALSHAKERPKRSVLFVWHCGEEKGLWGSQYFTDYPTIPLDRIVTQLNIDMIGRSKKEGDTNPSNAELAGPNEIYVIGSKMMSTELGELTETVNKSFLNLTFNYRYNDPKDPNRFFYRSDHFNYARKGIPIVFFFDGVHEDYHKPGDEPQKIDYDKMEKVARTVYMMLWEVATRPARPKVDKPLPAQLQ
jgi:hypothetical protein